MEHKAGALKQNWSSAGLSLLEWATLVTVDLAVPAAYLSAVSGHEPVLVTDRTWTLYSSPDGPTHFLGIGWHRDPGEGIADISYVNIVPEGPENGTYIAYAITNETPYNAFYEIYNKVEDSRTDIEWNRKTMEGCVRAPGLLGDSDWHCWNGDLEDTPCP